MSPLLLTCLLICFPAAVSGGYPQTCTWSPGIGMCPGKSLEHPECLTVRVHIIKLWDAIWLGSWVITIPKATEMSFLVTKQRQTMLRGSYQNQTLHELLQGHMTLTQCLYAAMCHSTWQSCDIAARTKHNNMCTYSAQTIAQRPKTNTGMRAIIFTTEQGNQMLPSHQREREWERQG